MSIYEANSASIIRAPIHMSGEACITPAFRWPMRQKPTTILKGNFGRSMECGRSPLAEPFQATKFHDTNAASMIRAPAYLSGEASPIPASDWPKRQNPAIIYIYIIGRSVAHGRLPLAGESRAMKHPQIDIRPRHWS